MGRKYVDCRDFPSEKNCSLRIEGTEDEVLLASTEHALSAHGHKDANEVRNWVKENMKDVETARA